MRGADESQGSSFSYLTLEQRVPKDHPLRAMRRLMDTARGELSPRFDELYAWFGRRSPRRSP